MKKKDMKKSATPQSTGIGDEPLSEWEKQEAEELGLDEENYRIYRQYGDSERYAEWSIGL